jgi:hypothetical protein
MCNKCIHKCVSGSVVEVLSTSSLQAAPASLLESAADQEFSPAPARVTNILMSSAFPHPDEVLSSRLHTFAQRRPSQLATPSAAITLEEREMQQRDSLPNTNEVQHCILRHRLRIDWPKRAGHPPCVQREECKAYDCGARHTIQDADSETENDEEMEQRAHSLSSGGAQGIVQHSARHAVSYPRSSQWNSTDTENPLEPERVPAATSDHIEQVQEPHNSST